MSVETCQARLDDFETTQADPGGFYETDGQGYIKAQRAGEAARALKTHAPEDLRLLLKVVAESLKTVEALTGELAELAKKHHLSIDVDQAVDGYLDAVKAFQALP